MGGEGLPRDPDRDPQRQLHRRAPRWRISRALHGRQRPRRARMHRRSAAVQGRAGVDRRRHRQAADGLRLPRADHELPVAGTMMIEPTEIGIESRNSIVSVDAMIAIRREIAEPSRTGAWPQRDNPLEARAAHRRRSRRRQLEPALFARGRLLPGRRLPRSTNTGRRSTASTMSTATATSSAPVRRWKPISRWRTRVRLCHETDRGRERHCWCPPAQIRTSPIRASGSYLGCLTAKRSLGQG